MQIWLQRLMPQHGLSRLVGKLAGCRWAWLKNVMIRWFIRHYSVNMQEAAETNYKAYPHFNAFFTRALKKNARPMPKNSRAVISPVDGFISEVGKIHETQLLQAKGHTYTLSALLAREDGFAEQFINGSFLTAYLSPSDYHRVHMPVAGHLIKMVHVPGVLFSVNPYTVHHVPHLFARNERVICLFETELGPMAMILVGAVIVASIATTWHGLVTPPTSKNVQQWHYLGAKISLARGEEMGQFQLGSTVIVLFGQNQITWQNTLQSGDTLRLGQVLGKPV